MSRPRPTPDAAPLATEPETIDLVVESDGTKFWLRGNEPHRDDGPAIEYANGLRVWCQNGQPHREDGPALYSITYDIEDWFWRGVHYDTRTKWLRGALVGRPLTPPQRELLHALSENWAGTPERLYETVTHLAE